RGTRRREHHARLRPFAVERKRSLRGDAGNRGSHAMSLYREILEERCAKHLSREPDLAKTVAQVLARLRNHEIYEQELVDAIFQKWNRFPINFTDAYGFAMAYSEILQGGWRIARIMIG